MINASGLSHTEHSGHCHNARKLQRIMHLMMMMTSTQRVALMAHITNYQICQSLTEAFVLCAHRSIQSWRWIQGRQETIPVLWLLLCAQMPPQQHMCLMTASNRCRRTIVRPIARTRHGRMNTSFLPPEGPCRARPLVRLEDRKKRALQTSADLLDRRLWCPAIMAVTEKSQTR